MDKTLQLRVIAAMQDKLSGPLKAIVGHASASAKGVNDLRTKLRSLNQAQRDINGFRELSGGLRTARGELSGAQQRVAELAAKLRQTTNPTRELKREFDQAVASAGRLKESVAQQSTKLQEMRSKLSAAGISTQSLATHERTLRNDISATTGAMNQQISKLEAIAVREKRLASARKSMHAIQGVAANMAIAGYATRAAGTHMLGGMGETLSQAKTVENESLRIRALGLGEGNAAEAVRYARNHRQTGTSASDNVQLMRDAMTIFADEHHAQMVLPTLSKMKFANEAVYGAEDAHVNEQKFMNMLKVIELRGGTKDEATFKQEANMVQKVLTATGGRVGGDEWRNFIQTGGVAAKQMRNDAFYYQMEPLIQEMGGHAVGTGLMSAYQNIYQGKTTVRAAKQMMALGLLDPKKVEYNKIGMIKQVRPGALYGGDTFKASPLEWMEKVLLPKMAAKGVTDPDKIKDMLATIFTNRTAANLFTTLYMQRTQIHKNERLNAGADDINALASKATDSTQGREVELLAKVRDLKLELGEKVSPLYNAALQKTAELTGSVVSFMKEHSSAATALVTVLTILGGLLAAGGTLGLALASILGPMAILKFSMSTLGMEGSIAMRGLGLVASGVRLIGTAFAFVGELMLLNPIGLTITALAVAAFLIYKYWDPIKAFFLELWTTVSTAFNDVVTNIKGYWDGLVGYFTSLAATFTQAGSHLVQGLIDGITNMGSSVKDAITGLAGSTVDWFKEKLGIHSPSRVMMEMGGYVSEGAAMGIENKQGMALRAAQSMAAGVMAAGALMPLGASAASASNFAPLTTFDTRPALTSASSAAGAAPIVVQGDTITIQIHVAGGDPHAIARAVDQVLRQRDAEKAARMRSAMRDND